MNQYVRVEKRKWNGATSTADERARLVAAPAPSVAWFVPRGSERARHARAERLAYDELWLAATDDWWVLCAQADDDEIVSLVLHAAVPVDVTPGDEIVWIDLDLDYEVHGTDVALEDEAEFHRHAASMAYPLDVIRGAWAGISHVAPRHTIGEWPFDGWLDRSIAEARATSA